MFDAQGYLACFRKYLKKLEDEDKWSCLNCDASPLREQRAHFWAITRFHKVRSRFRRREKLTSLVPCQEKLTSLIFYQEKLSAKLGKAPPANPSSPATPKKSSKVNTFKSHQNLSFDSKGWRSRRCEQWAVSSKWEKSKCCCSYSGKRLQRCGWGQNVSFCSENVHNSQHCGVIAGTLSLRHSARSGT